MNNTKKQPKYKGELRQAIIENVNAIKDSVALKEMCILSDILRREYDENEFKTLTDNEWDVIAILNNIISYRDSKELHSAASFIKAYFSIKKKGGAV